MCAPNPADSSSMSSTSACSSCPLSTQISTAVAKMSLDAQAEQGREIVKIIASAQAIQDANATISSQATPSTVDKYA